MRAARLDHLSPANLRGFTLVEVAIVLAILGILAAVALPTVARLKLRSRASEGKLNLAAIRNHQEAYLAEHDTYLAAALAPRPVASLSGDAAGWNPTAAGFARLGWLPEGDVFYSYQVTAGPAGCGGPSPCLHYTAEGVSDIDADGERNWWGYVKAGPAGTSVAGSRCIATGVYDALTDTQSLRSTIGPCEALMGMRIF